MMRIESQDGGLIQLLAQPLIAAHMNLPLEHHIITGIS